MRAVSFADPEMWFVHARAEGGLPGDRVRRQGLIKAAIRDNNPVIFSSTNICIADQGEIPDGDYVVPIGKARVAREGVHLSVITYAAMLHVALEAAEILSREGIDVESWICGRFLRWITSDSRDRGKDEQGHHSA